MTPLVIQIVILFVKILAELLLIILVPAFALKFFKKDLSFGLAFSASILMILLPVLTYVNNAELNNTILPFAAWGVASVLTLSWMTWGLSTGAIISFLYAAYLIVESRSRGTINLVLLFTGLGYLLNCFLRRPRRTCFSDLSEQILPKKTYRFYACRWYLP